MGWLFFCNRHQCRSQVCCKSGLTSCVQNGNNCSPHPVCFFEDCIDCKTCYNCLRKHFSCPFVYPQFGAIVERRWLFCFGSKHETLPLTMDVLDIGLTLQYYKRAPRVIHSERRRCRWGRKIRKDLPSGKT